MRIKCKACHGTGITKKHKDCPVCFGFGFYNMQMDEQEVALLLIDRLNKLMDKYDIELPVPEIGERVWMSNEKICEILGEILGEYVDG